MNIGSRLKATIRDIPDYPKPGIIFKDISPVLVQPDLVRAIVDSQAKYWSGHEIDAVAGIEARGFIFGSLLANALNLPFVLVRKAGKLPYTTYSEEYALEYGSATVEMHTDAVRPGWKVLIHDDLLATGGTAIAAGNLVERSGGLVQGFSFLINLGFLPGAENLENEFRIKPFYLVEY